LGADHAISYSLPKEELFKEITTTTEGKLHRIFDATGQNLDDSVPIFTTIGGKDNWAANTNDW
jgi:hypothetical protein